ncbi:MAG: amidohydrolase, partial [Lachnospiraceae bacterium]|nr:amidohydrolase [Lachnospiraceae bacterium]
MRIINGRILTMANTSKAVIENGYVQIENGKIDSVGDMGELTEGAEQVIDVQGAWVMPGLIDAHCHVGISEEKWGMIADDCNEMTSPVTPHLRAIDAINPMDPAFHDAIIAGITSLMTGPGSSNVVGGQSVFMKVQGRQIDKMVVKAPAAMKIAFGENPKTNYGGKDVMPGSRLAIGGMLREELFQAKEYLDKKKEGKLSERNFRLESWEPVFSGEIPLKAHVHRADDILTAIRIAKEFGLKMTLDHCTEGHLIAD